MAYLHKMPQEFIDLRAEIQHHPELVRKLDTESVLNPNFDQSDLLGEIAAYLNIQLEGYYGPLELSAQLTKLLIASREPQKILTLS